MVWSVRIRLQERVRVGESHRAQLRVGEEGAVIVADVRGEEVQPGADIVTHIIKVRVPAVDVVFAAPEIPVHVLYRSDNARYGECLAC